MTCTFRYQGNKCSLRPYGECPQDNPNCQRAESFNQRLTEIRPQVTGRLSDVQGVRIVSDEAFHLYGKGGGI